MGYEEIDYSEEAKYDLFESVQRERLDWAACLISRLPPSFEQVAEALGKLDLAISRKDYEKTCKKLGK